jgi:hypothetical protein
MPTTQVAPWLSETLGAGGSGRRWPKDEEFRDELLRYRAYAQPLDRCRFILETIELWHNHKENATFSNATIEHVMPQTLTDEWRAMLGENADSVHERWIDILGNLTLTGYNGPLWNHPFPTKRQIFAESHFEINKWIADQEIWTEAEIKTRSNILFEKAREIWTRPTG